MTDALCLHDEALGAAGGCPDVRALKLEALQNGVEVPVIRGALSIG